MKKTAKIVPLMLALVFLLTGCVKLNMDFVIRADEKADLSMILAVKKDVLNGQSIDSFIQQFGGGSDPFENLPEGATKEPYADETYEGYKVSAVNQPLNQVMTESATGSNGKIEHRDGKFFVETSAIDMGGNSSQAKQVFSEATMSFTFPGKIVSATEGGTINGNRVTYNIFDLANGTVIKVEAEDGSGPDLTWLWWVLGALALVVIVGLVWFFLRRNKGNNDDAARLEDTSAVPAVPADFDAATGAPVASAGAAGAAGAGAISGAPAPVVTPVEPEFTDAPPLPDHAPHASADSDEDPDKDSTKSE